MKRMERIYIDRFEWFAWYPVKTRTGWAWLSDVNIVLSVWVPMRPLTLKEFFPTIVTEYEKLWTP